VKKRSYIHQYRLLEQFTRMALDLFDQALLIHAEGIQFFENPAGPAWERAICQICGEEINEPPVCCYRCNTPHHRECWNTTEPVRPTVAARRGIVRLQRPTSPRKRSLFESMIESSGQTGGRVLPSRS